MFEVRIQDSEIKALERSLKSFGGKMGTVMSRALNKTATTGRAEISRELSKRIGIPVGKVKDKIKLHKASFTNWRSAVTLSGRRFSLLDMKAKQLKAGVKYQQAETRQRVLIRSAFTATMSSGHQGVFKRKGSDRLPISELFGPSLAGLYGGAEDLAARILRQARQRLEQNIAYQVELILKRRAG